jgi:hypothetical protein
MATPFRRMALVALFLGIVGALPARAQPAPGATVPVLGLAGIPDSQTDVYIAKSNAVVGLLNTSMRAAESWSRYLSWVDVKRGPTGRERIIYGLYSVSASSAREAADKARELAAAEPPIPALDGASKELAARFEALVPLLNEAEAYYDRKDYLSDGMKGGQALHAKLVPAAEAFLGARARVRVLQEQFKTQIDLHELARLEKTEGKSVRWHARRAMIAASRAVDLMPRDPRKPGDLKAWDDAIAALADAARDFDNAVRESGKSGSIDRYPRSLVGRMREIRDKIAKRQIDPNFYSMDFNGVISEYNMMITMSNAFR